MGCFDGEGKAAVGHRKSTGHFMPSPVTSGEKAPTIVSHSKDTSSSFAIHFTVPKSYVRHRQTKLMWSVGPVIGTCSRDSPIGKHTNRGFLKLPMKGNLVIEK